MNVAFSVALVPFISAAIANGKKKEAVNKINYSLKVSSIIAFPCAAGLCILAQPIFNLLFPNATAGAPLLQIQCWMIIFSVIDQTLSGSLQGLGKLYAPGLCLAIGAVIKYILNVIFIPIYGEVVPAVTTVIYNFVACALSFIILFRTLKQKPNMKEIFVKPIFATIVMSIVTIFVYKLFAYINIPNMINTIMTILIAVLAYAVCVILFKALSDEEISQLPYGNKICKVLRKNKKNI